jgi:hypothetical protein
MKRAPRWRRAKRPIIQRKSLGSLAYMMSGDRAFTVCQKSIILLGLRHVGAASMHVTPAITSLDSCARPSPKIRVTSFPRRARASARRAICASAPPEVRVSPLRTLIDLCPGEKKHQRNDCLPIRISRLSLSYRTSNGSE